MFRFDIIINCIMLIGFTVILAAGAVRRSGPVHALYCVLLGIALGAAYFIKLGVQEPSASIFIPFYKLYAINEFSHTGIIDDLVTYALPYVLAGFFFMPAMPRFGIVSSFFAGILFSICSRIYFLLEGGSFVTDEYLFAGIGMAAGCALYIMLAYILRKKIDFKEYMLPLPQRRSFVLSLIIWVILYVGIAFMMIFDYGAPYDSIVFGEDKFKLPSEITLNCSLEKEGAKLFMYEPSSQPIEERLTAVAQSVGIYDDIKISSGAYVAESEAGKVTMTESGSWVYDSYSAPEGELPTRDSAVNAVFRFFSSRQILSTDIDRVTDIIERTDTGSGSFIGYDIYLSSSVAGNPIVDSCAIVVSVRAGNSIVKVRRYDGDIQTFAQINGISPEKAYSHILSGQCANTLEAEAVSASINSYKLVYMNNSTQGYYLPVWCFNCTATEEDGSSESFNIYVQADK